MTSPVITPRDNYLEGEYLEDEYLAGGFDYAYGMQVHATAAATKPTGMQLLATVEGATKVVGCQARLFIDDEAIIGMQVAREADGLKRVGQQVNLRIAGNEETVGFEAKIDTLRHALVGTYLVDPYLENPYLVEQANAFLGMQVELTQVKRVGMQVTRVVYNNTQFRILDEFTSRGTAALDGETWTASNTAAGDFGANNLNTDIEEQVYRSATETVELVCDTGVSQGVTIDTLAIRNHNLTRSATVQLQGSTSSSFASVAVSIDLTVETRNMYYIAPIFPTGVANQNRYWRLVISDPTNPDGYVEIGVVVFGTARLFNLTETYDNPLTKGLRHFKDSLPTEGFTAVSNDRALKKYLRINFGDLERIKGNLLTIETYTELVRTSLKALVIPTPLYPSRYAVFAKLTGMPEYSVRNVSNEDDPDGLAEYVSFSLEWDEGV